MNLLEWFHNGGYIMYVILLINLMAVLLLLLSIIVQENPARSALNKISILFIFIPLSLGLLGSYLSHLEVASALEAITDPEARAKVSVVGKEIAYIPVNFGGVSSIFLSFLYLIRHLICKSLTV